ncbi:hypothetical protein [Bradyrhizobium sp. USDA 3256]
MDDDNCSAPAALCRCAVIVVDPPLRRLEDALGGPTVTLAGLTGLDQFAGQAVVFGATECGCDIGVAEESGKRFCARIVGSHGEEDPFSRWLEPERKLALPSGLLFWYHVFMKSASKKVTKKSRGRPATGVGIQVGERWSPEAIAEIDDWRRNQADMPGRPEAIRRLVEIGLKVRGK